VLEVLTTYGTATLELTFYALIVAFLVGIPFGLIAAYYRDRAPDALLRVFAIFFYATPVFFLGLLFKLVFAVGLDWLPVAGRASTGAEIELQTVNNPTGIYLIDAFKTEDPPQVLGDVLQHAILPGLALGLLTASIFLRLVRTNVIGTLGAGYVEAARSRGVGEYRLLRKHAYRPALIPIITVIGLQVAVLLGGAVLTETTFEWKGLGFQLYTYLQARDFVAVQGIVMLLAVIVAVTNFIVDIVAALIDPRVRY
jgi:peptide/nickel transport system permease protein